MELGICQLCPDHCNSCEYVYYDDSIIYDPPVSILNCTSCHSGYSTNWENGKCEPCPDNCVGGCTYRTGYVSHAKPWGVVGCVDCLVGWAYDSRTGHCIKCPDHCLECYTSIKGQWGFYSCSTCESGYQLQTSPSGQVICVI